MPILKNATTPNGTAVGFHKIKSATVDYTAGTALAQVASWPTEQAHNEGLGLTWMWPVVVPIDRLADIETALCELSGSPFLAGVTTADMSEGLDAVKMRKNAEINAARLAANRTTFVFAGKDISCDELSRSDIDGVNGIVALTAALPPGFPNAWKALDNTYVSIPDVATWTAFYAAMVAKGTENFAHSQQLKAQLEAATTHAQVEAIQW
jgi:hypothetical protein